LAEDNLVNQEMTVRLLQKMGQSVDAVSNGKLALAATRAIRALGARGRLPIVALTANAMPGDRQICLAAATDGFLPKPIGINDLRAVLENYQPLGV
jgi:CheY-like chemotaxis protein